MPGELVFLFRIRGMCGHWRVQGKVRARPGQERLCSLAMGQSPIFFLLFVCTCAGQAKVTARAPLLDIPSELLGDVNKPYGP